MKKGHSLANRLIALALSVFMVLSLLPNGALAEAELPAYGTVESLTPGVTVTETGKDMEATFAGNLNWIAADAEAGRAVDGWWVGLKVNAPETVNLLTAKYVFSGQERSFNDYKDSSDDADQHYITYWCLVNEEFLRSANQTDGLSTYTWQFDWDGDGNFEQTMKLDIDAARTVLYKDGSTQVYPAAPVGNGLVTGITPGAAITEENGQTTVTYSGIELQWSPADTTIGRFQDGWWVGMQITAPAQLTKEADFTNVTYQRFENGTWSEAKSFWNAQDSDKNAADTQRYLTMWGLITPALVGTDNDGVLTYQYRFDWNQDGIYEQMLVLKVDAETVKLMKDGIQQFPLRFGAVESLSGGQVTGSGTADSQVTFTDITLNWDAANPAVGRVYDGWWIGTQITAPEDMTTQDLFANVTYQRFENGTWSEAKSFWNAQDSDMNAVNTPRYLTVWGLITPELIAADNDGVLTYQYRFDWNQDGEYEQLLTIQLDVTEVTLLDENGVQIYPTLGNVTTLTGGAVSGNGTGNTVVEIDDVQLTWSKADETVGRGQDGWWVGIKVTAPNGADLANAKFRRKLTADTWTEAMAFAADDGTEDTMQLWGLVTAEYLDLFIEQGRNLNYVWQFSWDGDDTYEQTVTMTVDPNGVTLKQEGFGFVIESDTIVYNAGNTQYPISKPEGNLSGDVPVYAVEGNEGEVILNEDGTLTILKAGEVTIVATLTSEHFETVTDSYVLTINKADQTDFAISNAPASVTWQAAPLQALELVGCMGNGEVVWNVTEATQDVAKVEADGTITLLKAGTFVLQVQKKGDECYNDSAVVEVTIEVKHADQDQFALDTEKDTVTFNDVDKKAEAENALANQYTIITMGGVSTGKLVYEIVNYDPETCPIAFEIVDGVVTIVRAGTVTIRVTKEGDDQYNAATKEFTLTVEKADQSFTFDHDEVISELYGLYNFQTQITVSALNSGLVTYAVSENNIGAAVDQTGLVTFVDSTDKVGKVTVTVTLEGDDCYNPYSDTYVIELDYEKVPEAPYTLTGDKLISGSDWFTGDVTIIAPNGYQVSYSNALADNTWGNTVVWTQDGCKEFWDLEENKASAPVIYLKNMETGAITDAIAIPELKRDTQTPVELSISYEVSVTATILEKLFGFNATEVRVTVTAKDTMSGIGKMEYSLDGGETYTEIVAQDGVYSFVVSEQYRGQLYLRATDVAGNAEVIKHLDGDTDKVLVIDKTAPGIEVSYSGTMNDSAVDGIRYVNGNEVTIYFVVSDENYDLREADPIVTVNGEVITGWTVDETTGNGKLQFTLTAEGDYIIKATFTDRLGRTVEYESEVRIDRTVPVTESDIEEGKYYTEDQTFTLTITEHNFDSSKVELVVSAVDSKGNAVLTEDEVTAFNALAKDLANWNHEEGTDVYTLELPITVDGNYTVTVNCTDKLDWAAETHVRTFTLDKIDPDMPQLTYEVGTEKGELIIETILEKLFGFAKEAVVVTVHSGDASAGIAYLEYKLHDEDAFTRVEMDADGNYTFTLDPQYRGRITVVVYDKAGRATTLVEDKDVVVDNIAPKVEIEFTGDRQDAVKADAADAITRETMGQFDATTRFIYNGNVTVTIKVTEANFFAENEDMDITITHDGVVVEDLVAAGITDSGWQFADDVYTRTFVMTVDGDYQVIAEYRDHSLNDMEWESGEYQQAGQYRYTSNIHTIDTTKPVYEIVYDNNVVIQTLDGREYYDDVREATITVTDRNFRPSEVVFTVTEVDMAGAKTEFTYSDLTSWEDWTSEDGITWTAKVPFNTDANYTVDFSYDDLANNYVKEAYNALFTVDTQEPINLKVTYNDKSEEFVNEILEAITFGYFQAEQEVILTMSDLTAGIDYIVLTVTAEGPDCATDVELPVDLVIYADGTVKSGTTGFIQEIRSEANNGDLTLSFDVPAQFRGKFSFVAYDKSGNSSGSHEDPGVLVVDTVKPGYTISYNPSNVVNVADMDDMTEFDAANGIQDITDLNAVRVMYFSTDAVATIAIEEANFDPATVIIEVRDAAGNLVTDWVGSDWTTTTEEGKTDVHTKTVTIAAEGDYQIKVYYQDRSKNEAVDYLSQWIVVDKTAPVIEVVYDNTDVKNTIDGRDYFDAHQSATITITEHNFRADDVVITVTAENVLGQQLQIVLDEQTGEAGLYYVKGCDHTKWTKYAEGTWRVEDDKYVITLAYTTDANYTFDIAYTDLAKNEAADYEADLFTVDTTNPTNLDVSYSTNVFEEILESITFGYYNAQMTVTITAEDIISGIYHFAYSYINSQGVSSVNAQLLNQAIRDAQITYDGAKATATFNVPKMVLGDDNQFNGTVEFTAFDRSENQTKLKDKTRIVVDNISPTATITYNAPVQEANGISYYAGNIDALIQINEANFDYEDVVVTVTKDGQSYPVNVTWRDDSVDIHSGTFTLTEDGDYIVSVTYRDKSGNKMNDYTSNELTLDTTKPTIEVSDIVANSANKDESYGFTITFNDINLDASTLKPVLKAVLKTAEGAYQMTEIDLGDAVTVVEGQTYTYTVENLPEDALYTLICQVQDMSGNVMDQIVLEDGKSYEQVQFSINRNGSTFGYGDTFTEELVDKYFVYSVDADVVVVEVNVDPIENYKVTLNGKELVEGTDYTTTQTSNDGEWSKRTYTINKELFVEEGEYNIIVSSVDKAESSAFSDVKNLSLAFVVDQTKPVLTITGLETNGRYQTEEQTVTLIPTDEGGRLNSLKVIVLDADGNPYTVKDTGEDISVRFDMAGEELLEYLEENDGKITFTIPQGLNNQVQIICNDCAVNAEGQTNTYDELFQKVTVSTNGLIIFYANSPLFIGTVVGVVAAIALAIFLIKRKKNQANAKK